MPDLSGRHVNYWFLNVDFAHRILIDNTELNGNPIIVQIKQLIDDFELEQVTILLKKGRPDE